LEDTVVKHEEGKSDEHTDMSNELDYKVIELVRHFHGTWS